MTTRRRFLGIAGGVAVAALSTTGFVTLSGRRVSGGLLPSGRPLPAPFTVPLPVPPVARPVRTDGQADYYEVVQRAADIEILPGTRTRIWGYDGAFPGPTFAMRSGRRAVVRVRNDLPVPTSTHLHGGVTPPESDGYPTDLVVPAGYQANYSHSHTGHPIDPSVWRYSQQAKDYVYPNQQRGATLWYHDHRMDFTAPQVWRGLAGFALLRDAREDSLPLPAGDRDIPLMICDRSFEEDGSFRYPALDARLAQVPGVSDEYSSGVLGDVILVNGAPWPVLEVDAARYRLRILNASNARRYQLALNPAAPLVQVGSDSGLLARPVSHTALTVAPGERFDVVVDFSAYPVGTEVTLLNTLETGATGQIMRFRVARRGRDDSALPDRLTSIEPLNPDGAAQVRTFDFRTIYQDGRHVWTVNGQLFDPSASVAQPRFGTVERWRFSSDFHHPIHLHLVHFQVLSRNGRTPQPSDGGWKDTVDVRPYEVLEVLVRFDGFRGRYMMHCHNLEHEDMAMMANFDVV